MRLGKKCTEINTVMIVEGVPFVYEAIHCFSFLQDRQAEVVNEEVKEEVKNWCGLIRGLLLTSCLPLCCPSGWLSSVWLGASVASCRRSRGLVDGAGYVVQMRVTGFLQMPISFHPFALVVGDPSVVWLGDASRCLHWPQADLGCCLVSDCRCSNVWWRMEWVQFSVCFFVLQDPVKKCKWKAWSQILFGVNSSSLVCLGFVAGQRLSNAFFFFEMTVAQTGPFFQKSVAKTSCFPQILWPKRLVFPKVCGNRFVVSNLHVCKKVGWWALGDVGRGRWHQKDKKRTRNGPTLPKKPIFPS